MTWIVTGFGGVLGIFLGGWEFLLNVPAVVGISVKDFMVARFIFPHAEVCNALGWERFAEWLQEGFVLELRFVEDI